MSESSAFYPKTGMALTGIILAGGQGSRMGGADKGWVEFKGKPLLEHVIERLRPQVGSLLIVANRHQARYQRFATVVSDEHTGFLGPLAGIHAGLNAMQTQAALVVPVDAPLLSPTLAEKLLSACSPSHTGPIVCICNQGKQPLFGVYHKKHVASMAVALQQERYGVVAWCERNSAKWLNWGSETFVFHNCNAPADLNTPINLD